MHLYANGCSFTWGGGMQGHVYDDDPDLEEYRRTHTWPFYLHSRIGADSFTNDAMGCGSNERILRTTISWFSLTDYRPEDVVAVIQWSVPTRRDFYSVLRKQWIVMAHDTHTWDGTASPPEKALMEMFYKFWNNEEESLLRTLTYILSLQSYFKTMGIRYLMYWGFTPNPQEFLIGNVEARALADQIDQSCFLWGDPKNPYAMFNHMVANHPANLFKTGHPRERGHEQWAEFLVPHVRSVL